MSSKFKLNKADVTQDSKMNSVEWHLAEKIYDRLNSFNCLHWAFDNIQFIDLGIINREKFLNLAKEILGEEKSNDDSREN